MHASAPPSAPASAATEPPPGAGDSRDTSSTKSHVGRSTSGPSTVGIPSTFSWASNGPTSRRPMDWTAVSMRSATGTPVDFIIRRR